MEVEDSELLSIIIDYSFSLFDNSIVHFAPVVEDFLPYCDGTTCSIRNNASNTRTDIDSANMLLRTT